MNYGVGDWVVCIEDAGIPDMDRCIKVGTKLAVRKLLPVGSMVQKTFTVAFELAEWGVYFVGHANKSFPSGVEVPYPARKFRKLLRSDLPTKSPATRQPKAVTQ